VRRSTVERATVSIRRTVDPAKVELAVAQYWEKVDFFAGCMRALRANVEHGHGGRFTHDRSTFIPLFKTTIFCFASCIHSLLSVLLVVVDETRRLDPY
jgi:hypothetical protein